MGPSPLGSPTETHAIAAQAQPQATAPPIAGAVTHDLASALVGLSAEERAKRKSLTIGVFLCDTTVVLWICTGVKAERKRAECIHALRVQGVRSCPAKLLSQPQNRGNCECNEVRTPSSPEILSLMFDCPSVRSWHCGRWCWRPSIVRQEVEDWQIAEAILDAGVCRVCGCGGCVCVCVCVCVRVVYVCLLVCWGCGFF